MQNHFFNSDTNEFLWTGRVYERVSGAWSAWFPPPWHLFTSKVAKIAQQIILCAWPTVAGCRGNTTWPPSPTDRRSKGSTHQCGKTEKRKKEGERKRERVGWGRRGFDALPTGQCPERNWGKSLVSITSLNFNCATKLKGLTWQWSSTALGNELNMHALTLSLSLRLSGGKKRTVFIE